MSNPVNCKDIVHECIMYTFDKKMHSADQFDSFIDDKVEKIKLNIKNWVIDNNITMADLNRLQTEKYRLFDVDISEDYLQLQYSCFNNFSSVIKPINHMQEGDVREFEANIIDKLVDIAKLYVK